MSSTARAEDDRRIDDVSRLRDAAQLTSGASASVVQRLHGDGLRRQERGEANLPSAITPYLAHHP